jgi:hypothetical protein
VDNPPDANLVGNTVFELEAKIVRSQILNGEPRIDGRDTRTVRPITVRSGVLPRTHGSSLFTRGETQALVVANAVAQAVEFVGLPEAQINLAHGTTYLASRPKDNASYVGLQEALRDARQHGNLGVPLHLRNAVTSLMKDIGYGQGYRYVHDDPAARGDQSHLPDSLKGARYYRPRTSDDEERG